MKPFIIKVIKYLLLATLLSGLIIFLCLLTKPAFFLGAPALDYYYCTHQYEQINKKTRFSNIIIGDSKGNAALNPVMLGDKWVNLSIPGSDFFEGYITVKRYLQHNNADTVVMVYGLNYIAENSPYFPLRTIPFQFVSYSELNELEQVERKYKYVFHGTALRGPLNLTWHQFDRKLKYLHFPFSYRATFIDGWNKLCTSQADINPKKEKILKQLSDYRGYMNFGDADSNNTDGVNPDYHFNPKQISQHYLDLLMKLAAEKKLTVILAIAPMNQASFSSYCNSKLESTANAYFKNLQKKYPDLIILETPLGLPNSMFGDPYHLNKKGTSVFSEITRNKLSEKVQ
ncbi:hypothetical protein [Longitalea luteola]|uniref:hypothetical protein n=1 Tax=Longitalea luteola TaxID=2812563 RepID=UPI001A967C38|nr:hypothetical protein [Longitalea luteola]